MNYFEKKNVVPEVMELHKGNVCFSCCKVSGFILAGGRVLVLTSVQI